MNWTVFNLKYDNREQWAFEQMSYLLFCAEFGNRIGLFRYKNQTGIETDPIVKDGIYYGFQAKYYISKISQNKGDVIDSIQKAKSKNNQLNVIYLYLNQELSESSKTNKKKPEYQCDIEKAAKKIGIDVQWRVPSHFELQIALPENKYIYDIFFNLDSSGVNLIDDVFKHNENLLRAIQTEINYFDKQIKIDRCDIIDQIVKTIENNQNIIISGEGGCGKTAILKDFYYQAVKEIPICIFKATELNVNNINDLFRLDNNFTFSQFIELFLSESKKIFVIDSAEKLAESTNNDILIYLIQTLKDNGWSIIFTTRYSYLNDLSFHIKENYHLSCKVIDIPIISNVDLIKISTEYSFILPDNQNFVERLRNLFYLNEYMQYYANIDKQGSFRSFVDLLWKKRIQNSIFKKDNLHIEREKCIIQIAKERCETGFFYINAEKLNQSALFKLKLDEILGYDEIHDGYFITHDIYEEWALDKVVSRNYANYVSSSQFFTDLGSSLAIRRAFRLWLSEQLFDKIDKIESFVIDTFRNGEVSQFWKDELLVSVLLSDYSETFFSLFEKDIVSDDFKILQRILFLLRIACTEISTTNEYDSIKPKGKGWNVVISFIYKHKSDFFEKNLNQILPILTDWCNNFKKGETTRFAGLLALSLIEKKATTDGFYIDRVSEEPILKIIYNSVSELHLEFQEIFSKVIDNKWNKHNCPYEEFISKILEKPYLALEVIKVLPKSVIELSNLFWQKQLRSEEYVDFRYERDSMENRYGLVDEFKFNYFPASAYQTPIYWLLQSAFKETLDFIIAFTNSAVESYRQSDYGKSDVEEIILNVNEQEVQQYLCWAFWGMYRGIGSPVVPYLLDSMHMALEKILLEYAQIIKPEIFEQILFQILIKSKSASLTAVVSSIVLANPNKLNNIALTLFKTIELFHIDLLRCTNEFQAKSLYSIGYGLDKMKDTFYTDERLKTCEDKHRSTNLESLFLNYQIFGVGGFSEEQNTEFIQKLYKILDDYNANFSTKPEYISKSYGILLARMDRRNLTAKVTKQDGNNFIIEFNPRNLSDELREQSNHATMQFENNFKYTSLKLWADFINKNDNSIKNSEKYNSNPLLALAETKQLVDELETCKGENRMFDHIIPPFSCSKLMIEHKDKLTIDERDFCKEIILATVSRLFSDNYDYQISDGVEASIHAIPSLMNEYPDEKESLILIMVLSLLDVTSIGQYKRICDYVHESIHESKLWDFSFVDAQAILLGYIKLKPIYNRIFNEMRKEKGPWERIPKSSIFRELEKQFKDFSFINFTFDIQDIDSFDIIDYELVYQLIPYNTKDKIHLNIYEKSLQSLFPKLLIDRTSYEDKFGNGTNIYLLRLYIFRRYARFLLEHDIIEIDCYLQPFIDNFVATEETSLLLEQFISTEDDINKYDQFWYIWNKLYPKFIEVCNKSNSYYSDSVIKSYLLAWQWWRDGVEEWHSLHEENLSFYANISIDLGSNPTVLFSISRVLNSVGSKYLKQGIDWINTIVTRNNSLNLRNQESNTLYYLERIMRKFVFNNSEQIKQDIRLKNKIIPILEFMIERGSIHGYLLRESIL